MITLEQRRETLGNFPAGTPFLVLAPASSGFAEIVRERNDPAVTYVELGSDAAVTPAPHVLIEGLDDVDEPAALLRIVRTAMPAARIFALIANGASFAAIGRFFAGEPIARAHPLTHGEIGPLFAAAGWNTLAIKPLYDTSLPAVERLPIAVTIRGFGMQCNDVAALERGRTAGYLVIADPAA
jgi:hypothetical protein